MKLNLNYEKNGVVSNVLVVYGRVTDLRQPNKHAYKVEVVQKYDLVQ